MDETQGFLTLGIQIGPFAACKADFVPKKIHFPDLYTGAPLSYYPREGKRGEAAGAGNGKKGFTQK